MILKKIFALCAYLVEYAGLTLPLAIVAKTLKAT